jgi:hypothetical protein
MNYLFSFIFLVAAAFTYKQENKTLANLPCYQKANLQIEDSVFYVDHIDSVNTFYLIYASHAKGKIKIVSKKGSNNNCDKIQIKNSYTFSLHSIWTRPIMMGNVNVSPSLTPHVTGLYFDDSTVIRIDRDNGIYDLYDCDNLKGLCYFKPKE